MAIETAPLTAIPVIFTDEERALLLQMLEHALGEIRVEVHHTRTPDYHEQLLRQELVIRGLIQKFRPVPG